MHKAANGISSGKGARRGAILVGVLWIAMLLAALAVTLRVHMSSVAASVRMTEEKAAARAIADAGLALAAARVRAAKVSSDTPPDRFSREDLELPAGRVGVMLANEALRVDINKAAPQLVTGALVAAGAPAALAATLTERITERRAEIPETAPGPYQSLDEVAQVEGMPGAVAIALGRFATVSSGLPAIRLDAADEALLRAIPGLPPSTVSAITGWRAERVPRERVDDELAATPLHTDMLSVVWRVRIDVVLASGHTDAHDTLLFVGENDPAPYRVLDWRQATEETD